MRRLTVLVLYFSILLCGCSWMDGSYVSVTAHKDRQDEIEQEIILVENYDQLQDALVNVVENGVESCAISVEAFDPRTVEHNISMAIRYVTKTDPLGAYAVDSVTYEQGISGAQEAVAVQIRYNRNLSELRSVKRVSGMMAAVDQITSALDQVDSGVVLRIENYEDMDYVQLMQDYADENPEKVMEVPQVTVNTFPRTGDSRVLEIKFNYQSNRESLRDMQSRVQDVFSSARLYVSGDGETNEKYAQLYSFVTERYDYRIETSITPAYSLLSHGVGDSRAFATVYAAMCHRSGLECMVVSGTHEGEPWFWNIVCVEDAFYHVDLVNSTGFIKLADEEMAGYVWDYSAYPPCGAPEPEEGALVETGPYTNEPTQPATEATDVPETTEPAETTIQETQNTGAEAGAPTAP